MRRMRCCTGRPDCGAAAVEFALLFPIFIIVVMGTITAGTAFSKQINITQAARETSRYGATLTFAAAAAAAPTPTPTPNAQTWLSNVSGVGQAAAGPSTDPIGGHNDLCVAIVVPSPSANTMHMIDNNGTAVTGACPGTTINAALGPQYVQVVVKRKTHFFAVFLDKDLTLRSESTTPYEPGNAPVPSPAPTP